MSYINLYAILGAIPLLCKESNKAKDLIANDTVSIGFNIKDGPCATLAFDRGKCTFAEGTANCNIKFRFSKPEKFNAMIDGTITPIPCKGFTKLGFLLKKFMPLTEILSSYLKPSDKDLCDKEFFRVSTVLMFHVITEAMSHVGNNDKIGRASACYITDGVARIAIDNVISAHIVSDSHVLKTVHEYTDKYMSYMIFESLELARALFDGKINAVTAVGLGQVRIGGMISTIDNLNRILDRVAFYLA